ncbi:bifunctional 4-hydroxy-2-oxoglutarate aldolase/2-dehydro-3-deoxy-phosphogluconate aldolase [Roseburia hominis]
MTEIMEMIYNVGFVPVVTLHDVNKAVCLANALERGGIPIIEVTYRTEEASECIRAIRKECPNMLVGAGTVLSVAQAECARDSGAMFVVSPGYDEAVVEYCCNNQIPVIPGVSNAGEIQKGVAAGLKVLKLFPAEPIGGLSAIHYLAAPFPGIKFLPAGGVVMDNLAEYMSDEYVFACAGGLVTRKNLLESEDWEGISALCRQVIAVSLGFEFAHVGINCETSENAHACADRLEELFGFTGEEGKSSIFSADKRIEIMKKPFYGINGHIGFFTNSVRRAIYQLTKQGFGVIEESIRYDVDGQLKSVYLQDSLNGFMLHIVQKS